jgi:uncharacterized protein YjbJ (UPF0337 family)
MNSDILAGNWKQFKGKAQQFWGKLTDDEIDQVNGRVEELAGLLQKRYGYKKDEAEREIDRFLADQED